MNRIAIKAPSMLEAVLLVLINTIEEIVNN